MAKAIKAQISAKGVEPGTAGAQKPQQVLKVQSPFHKVALRKNGCPVLVVSDFLTILIIFPFPSKQCRSHASHVPISLNMSINCLFDPRSPGLT